MPDFNYDDLRAKHPATWGVTALAISGGAWLLHGFWIAFLVFILFGICNWVRIYIALRFFSVNALSWLAWVQAILFFAVVGGTGIEVCSTEDGCQPAWRGLITSLQEKDPTTLPPWERDWSPDGEPLD